MAQLAIRPSRSSSKAYYRTYVYLYLTALANHASPARLSRCQMRDYRDSEKIIRERLAEEGIALGEGKEGFKPPF